MDKTIIIGFGTGRCGTKSLASFLSQQQACNVSHEGLAMSWFPTVVNQRFAMEQLLKRPNAIVGDIGFYWIQYLDYINEKCPDVKMINLYRDDDETLQSFIHRTKTNGKNYSLGTWHDYPFDSDTMTEDDIARTLKRYRYLEKGALFKYPGKIYRLHIDLLNNMGHMKRLLDWIGCEQPYQLTPVHENKT